MGILLLVDIFFSLLTGLLYSEKAYKYFGYKLLFSFALCLVSVFFVGESAYNIFLPVFDETGSIVYRKILEFSLSSYNVLILSVFNVYYFFRFVSTESRLAVVVEHFLFSFILLASASNITLCVFMFFCIVFWKNINSEYLVFDIALITILSVFTLFSVDSFSIHDELFSVLFVVAFLCSFFGQSTYLPPRQGLSAYLLLFFSYLGKINILESRSLNFKELFVFLFCCLAFRNLIKFLSSPQIKKLHYVFLNMSIVFTLNFVYGYFKEGLAGLSFLMVSYYVVLLSPLKLRRLGLEGKYGYLIVSLFFAPVVGSFYFVLPLVNSLFEVIHPITSLLLVTLLGLTIFLSLSINLDDDEARQSLSIINNFKVPHFYLLTFVSLFFPVGFFHFFSEFRNAGDVSPWSNVLSSNSLFLVIFELLLILSLFVYSHFARKFARKNLLFKFFEKIKVREYAKKFGYNEEFVFASLAPRFKGSFLKTLDRVFNFTVDTLRRVFSIFDQVEILDNYESSSRFFGNRFKVEDALILFLVLCLLFAMILVGL